MLKLHDRLRTFGILCYMTISTDSAVRMPEEVAYDWRLLCSMLIRKIRPLRKNRRYLFSQVR